MLRIAEQRPKMIRFKLVLLEKNNINLIKYSHLHVFTNFIYQRSFFEEI